MNQSLKKYVLIATTLLISFNCVSNTLPALKKSKAIVSIETGFTILKVRSAVNKEGTYIVASSYEGTLLGVSDTGKILWKNALSGFMNHDIWVRDLDNDGADEILVANANGTIYCLDSKGKLLWQFKKNSAPMYAVTAIKKDHKMFVVAGGLDKSMYYLDAKGKFLKEIKSATYSIEKVRKSTTGTRVPNKSESAANFIRTIQNKDNTETLVVLGTNNHMNVVGTLYFFNAFEELPFKKTPIKAGKNVKGKLRIRPIGDFRVVDINNDGNKEIVLGASAHASDLLVSTYSILKDEFTFNKINKVKFGYDIAQSEIIKQNGETTYFTKVGSQIHLYKPNSLEKDVERLEGKYAYNDLWKVPETGKIILASAQSGGSQIHIIDTNDKGWKKEFENLEPEGKIASILKNTKSIRDHLKNYTKPNFENKSQTVYFMTEKVPNNLLNLKNKISNSYDSPIFLNSMHLRNVEKWDRSQMNNQKYKNAKDRRKKYTLTQKESIDLITKGYEDNPGVAYWAGHGNDPYMFQLSTTKAVIDKSKGKKKVLIYPEMEDHSENLSFLVNDLVYPLAEYAKDKNTTIFLRSKHVSWLGSNYQKPWARLMSGEFADVFVPSMEETTDKSMELSLAGRTGMWASGAVNSWGTRAVPDNTTFDRARQLGYQRLPNHFLRMLIFHTSNGAQFINNFAVDQDYLSIYWELIAKGALYVPKRNEILSFSPVHLSMKAPDHHFLDDGSNVKWNVFYDEEFEKNNPFVMSRLNGSWPAAPVTEWDFSRYAAGVKERRLNFLAPYENGLVMITPPQNGVFADKNAPRGTLVNNLHPLYKNIMKEYITDGRNYYSADGKQTFKADEYYKVIEKDLKASSKKLPITVAGDVAWVVAQTSPKHLRLTILDSGYINPEERTAIVHFNNINIKKITDILSKEEFKVQNSSLEINIPVGAFRFIDIELEQAL
ncbi:PQQ-binding-like beta-propeller repeat protein [Polaribacter staleyi]|uniref:outer membrane protein assembly factor BamB family protein n=1 Tax=Polaribacter staleyi TaxID=2022337 RepID=UPI0031BB6CFD